MMEKLFKVTITETLVRNLGVKAKNLEEATKKVNGLYLDAKINLMDENFVEDYDLKGEEVYRFEFNKLESVEALKIMEAK